MHVNALYVHDEQMRMLAINQWDGGVVPRFFLGRTGLGNVWRFRADLPTELIEELEALCVQETGAVLKDPKFKDAYIHLLSAHEEIKAIWQGPSYYCYKPIKASIAPLHITPANAELLEAGLDDWLADVPYRQPFMAAIDNGLAVSVCASVRITDQAHEAGIETLSAYRRKGHAFNAVSGWANALLAKEIIPLYSTSWSNTASQNVAKKLGLSYFGADFHIT